MNKLGRGYRPKKGDYDFSDLNGVGIGLNSQTLLIIKLPDSWVLRVMSRSLFLAMFVLILPSICSVMKGSSGSSSPYKPDADSDTSNGFKILPILLRDLMEEGLIKKGHKGFVLNANVGDIEDDFEFLRDAGIDLHLQQKNVVEHQVFDFVFATSFHGIHLVDGILKDNGLVISTLGHDPSNGLQLLSSYKIVYLRRFENTVVAMRKTGVSSSNARENSASKEVFCGVTSEEKKAALKGLEDVYLEPPRRAILEKRSSFISRKIKFLPDLLKDSLDEYPRRVFISDDSSAIDWFYKNYPMRDQEFEVYNKEVRTDNNDGSKEGQDTGISTWLTKKVSREDYVVMKAEAQVVEEMLKDKTLCLVDELFLECKNQWQNGEEENGSKRAYWQCLALYGKVRDEGIAVHQWWS
ncbi:hypothetical protein CDL12_09654 [Handroanthus impetiginosus]|uniref:DUF7870 domain-containing protein n=1 Tax=Handroanthus impetiginosus TaxID=429701 RepID=A0A2G9HJI4_9LAMI|nr:hypothetical protein CDL12_09654 [Handroanthus impetiginosus]